MGGEKSMYSTVIIYGPLSVAVTLMIRDNMSKVMIISSCIALLHGLAHKVYPFLDSTTGVNHEVDVWQDQILHAFQGVLFGFIFWKSSGATFKTCTKVFVAGLVLNVLVAIPCWNSWCYDTYVWLSLIPATASGLHFAIGTLPYVPERVGWYACLMQGASSISTYFIFRSSDDILKFFAACRFFEVYFIAPHLVGAIYARLAVCNFAPLRQLSMLPHALFGHMNGSAKLTNPYSLWSGPKQACTMWRSVTSSRSKLQASKKVTGAVESNSLTSHAKDFMHAAAMIMLGNLSVGLNLAAIWHLGQDSTLAPLVIYAPLSLAVILMIRDKASQVMIVSSCIALLHGLAHKFYPFLDSTTGVNHEVDVWQDQILHAFQGVLFGFIFWESSGLAFKIFVKIFVAGLVLNVLVAIPCWN